MKRTDTPRQTNPKRHFGSGVAMAILHGGGDVKKTHTGVLLDKQATDQRHMQNAVPAKGVWNDCGVLVGTPLALMTVVSVSLSLSSQKPWLPYGAGACQGLSREGSLSEAQGSCFQVETSPNRNLSDSDRPKLCVMLPGGRGNIKLARENASQTCLARRAAVQGWAQGGRVEARGLRGPGPGRWVEARLLPPPPRPQEAKEASGTRLMTLGPIPSVSWRREDGEGHPGV